MRQAIKYVLRCVCPSLLPPLQKKLRSFRRLLWDDAWLVLPAVLPEDRAWLRRLEALVAAPPGAETEEDGRNRHLVLVTGSLAPGGAERQWCWLALELSRRGYRVTLLIVNSLEGENGHYLPLLNGSAVTVTTLHEVRLSDDALLPDPASMPKRAWELTAALQSLRPARVISQLDETNIWSGVAALLLPCPPRVVLLSFRNVNPTHFWFNQPYYHEYYLLLTKSPRIALNANARSNAHDYAAWLDVPTDRIAIAHNAVQIPERAPTTRRRLRDCLGIGAAAKVVLGVFRLSVEKNPMLFLEVADAVHAELPNVVFLLAGIGPECQTLEREAAARGMTRWFKFLGRRDDVPDLMLAADALLLCSHAEGLPNVLLEAQAAGLPVVATRVGGVPEAVLEGESGLLAEDGDVQSLSRYCLALLRDPQRCARMGQAGRRFVRANFTARSLGDRILDQLELPRSLPEPAASPPPRDGVLLETRYPQALLEVLLQKELLARTVPLLIFAPFPLASAIVSLLPAHSICLTLPGVPQPASCPTVQLDWRDPESHAALSGIVPRGADALMMAEWPHWQHLERKLKKLGVSWIVCHDDVGWRRFPVARLRVVRDVRGLARGIAKRLGQRFPEEGR